MAWRTLRRPLDMNEYAKVIQEIRVQPGSTKAHGKVFVKGGVVRRLQKLCIPIPNSLRSSLALSTTGFILSRLPNVLEPNAMIDQEFEPQ
ncbi:Bud site selection protein bud4, partial [Ceratobasidium sp. 423]